MYSLFRHGGGFFTLELLSTGRYLPWNSPRIQCCGTVITKIVIVYVLLFFYLSPFNITPTIFEKFSVLYRYNFFITVSLPI